MKAPDGYAHLGQEFWDRVEPDPESDCLIFKSDATRPTWRGKGLLFLLTGDRQPKHRACGRRMCANPDHIIDGPYIPPTPQPRRYYSDAQFDRLYNQC